MTSLELNSSHMFLMATSDKRGSENTKSHIVLISTIQWIGRVLLQSMCRSLSLQYLSHIHLKKPHKQVNRRSRPCSIAWRCEWLVRLGTWVPMLILEWKATFVLHCNTGKSIHFQVKGFFWERRAFCFFSPKPVSVL